MSDFRIRDRLTIRGTVQVIALDPAGQVLDVWEGPNIITDVGLDLLAAQLGDPASAAALLTDLAWGNNATAPTAADVALGNELARQAITSRTAGATGVRVSTTHLAPSTAVGQIEELGWWAGNVLWARVLYSRNKSDIEALNIVRTDTLARV